MSAPDASMDRPLHLSLPDWRTALKRRVKRPKRPSFWALFTIFYCVLAVISLLVRDWFSFIADASAISYGWWMVVNHRERIVWRYYLSVLVLCVLQAVIS